MRLRANPASYQFYDQLDAIISRIPTSKHVYLLGDFNARVGADQESWPKVLGHHGMGKLNDNGQKLLEFCCFHKLCDQHLLPEQRAPQNIMDTSPIKPLAPAGLGQHQS